MLLFINSFFIPIVVTVISFIVVLEQQRLRYIQVLLVL